MKRLVDKYLVDWKESPSRKSLLVRGARQVGKTYSVRELGKAFEHFVEINFEETPAVASVFEESLEPRRIVDWLSAYAGVTIVPGETLLFFDEIQACPNALSSLRFFHEKMPELHVVAAGSLLEFALGEIPSQGVGRIESLFMYPLSFWEFAEALGYGKLMEAVGQASPDHPLDPAFHVRLVAVMRLYQLIGGLPDVVQTYVDSQDINHCMGVLDGLVTTFEDDFKKYRSRVPIERLSDLFYSVARQAGGKFNYSAVNPALQTRDVKAALELLVKAGLVHRVVHTAARGIPIGADVNPKRFKVHLFDVGIHQRLLGLDIPAHVIADEVELVNKGSLAELVSGLELIAYSNPNRRASLFYWHREKRGSSAEVDYVFQDGIQIVPVEVKAGSSGKMRSLHMFLDERNLDRGIKISLENFSRSEKIESWPIYAIRSLLS